MRDKYSDMHKFWSDRVKKYGSDPKANTNDVWLREVEISAVEEVISELNPLSILDFGCANGYTTNRLAKNHPSIHFTGVDINENMIAEANQSIESDNISFMQGNIISDSLENTYDLIIAIRVFQNIESNELQKKSFRRLNSLLNDGGSLFFIESYAEGYEEINSDRKRMGLRALPIQPHLNLLTREFDEFAADIMNPVRYGSPSSSYYLVTRLAYSKLADLNREDIDYDHPLHRIAAALPSIGAYGPQKSALFRKR